MAENSKIQWTRHTFNPWRGCAKVSPGCAHCYAETLSRRNPKVLGVWGQEGTRVVAAESAWKEPLKWDRKAREAGERHRVFCASLADIFEGPETMPKNNWDKIQEARLRLFNLISHTPHLDWLLLTKRPENVLRLIDRDWLEMPNVWIGVSIEDQQRADERLPHLAEIPARVKFLSIEPLLGPIILNGWDGRVQRNWLVSSHPRSIDWVIIGGESGNSARSCTVDWIMGLVHTCRAAGVPVFVKQVGSSPYLKDPKGGDPNEWPEHMRVREFPNTNR